MYIVLLLLLITSGILGLLLWLSKQRSDKALSEHTRRIGELTEKNRLLTRYEGILEVDREIESRRRKLEETQQKAEAKAQRIRQEAEDDVQQQRKEINELKREAKEQQANMLDSASQEASRIIAEANKRAEDLAGDAMTALRDSRQLEATAKAMKNVIKGYGDEYLVPNRSLIDDLADEYSHKQAGVELKTARERSRQMIKSGLAAACDYAEQRRKETAIHFVVDAFNGKVDSILSRAKHDNFGKLDQEAKDAFSLVNQNGKAFRNARIQSEYLEARRTELRWAVAVNELRLQEREEQRGIRERMREEERARREYEKAIKDAAKEEKLLQQAMEKAQQELQAASQDERAQYQRQLEELETKLREAEEKNKRAISMAEQTKRGHVYIISNVGSFGDDVFKIGLTRRLQPTDRVRELGDASVPFEFDIHAMIFSEDAPALESGLHQVFKDNLVNLVNPRKEFFRTKVIDIKKTVEEMGLDVKWTMLAEAREYRETLAVQKSRGQAIRELPPPEPVQRETQASVADDTSPATRTPEVPSAEAVQSPPHPGPEEHEDAEHGPQTEQASAVPDTMRQDERALPCPFCDVPLLMSTLRVGQNQCPHCKKMFKAK